MKKEKKTSETIEEINSKPENIGKINKYLKIFARGVKIFFLSILTAISGLVLVSFFLGYGVYSSYAKSFDTAKKRSNSTQIVFYDKDNNIIYESYGAKNPDYIKISDVPEVIKTATLASEDADFYNHGAVDPKGLARAAYLNVINSDKSGFSKITDLFSENNYSQGGSSITQQLVKNLYLTNEKSFERKIKEIIYAIQIEKRESKDQILEDYLNNVYYGEQALGIKNAAKTYYDKDVSELDLAEVSMLVGLPVSPTRLSPISGDYEQAKKRQEYVLSKMVLTGKITLEQAKESANQAIYFNDQNLSLTLKYPNFVEYTKNELKEKIGDENFSRGGFEVYTSLNPSVQEKVEEITKEYIENKFKSRKVTNAAAVILDNKNYEISGMVGGINWEESKVNVATSLRQPGSSFKPIVYMSGLLSKFTASSLFADKYVNFGGNPAYKPRNYDGSYHGNVTMRIALANSLNIPAVEMAKLVGVDKIIETAKKLGITTLEEDNNYGLSIGLGSAEVKLFELTRAYSVFANNGRLASFTSINKIIDAEDEVVFEKKKSFKQVIDDKAAYIMTSILSDNKARSMVFGSSSPLYLKDRVVAAKTGTTDNYADSWTMGYTPNYTVGVWMGNNDRTVMSRVSGIEGAAYIWNDIMKSIHQDIPAELFTKPEGISEMWITPRTGLPSSSQRLPNILEYYIPGTEPTKDLKFDYLKVFGK